MNKFPQRWDHGPNNNPRFRGGKTAMERGKGHAQQRVARRAERAELIRSTPWHKPLPAVL